MLCPPPLPPPPPPLFPAAFTPGNIAALRIDTSDASALSLTTTARISIDEFIGGTTSAASRVQSIPVLGYCALSGNAYEGRLALSFSASTLSFGCYYLNSGMASLSAYAQRQVVTVSSGGVVAAPGSVMLASTSAWYSGPGVYSVAQDVTGSLYLGAGGVVVGNASLSSVGPTGGAVSAYGVQGSVTKVSLFANAAYACVLGSGIYRVPLRGALSLVPVLATTCGATCVDFVFQSGQIREYGTSLSEVRFKVQHGHIPLFKT